MHITFEHHREDGTVVTTRVTKACCTTMKQEVWVADMRPRVDSWIGTFLHKPNLETLSYFLAGSYLPGFNERDRDRRILQKKTQKRQKLNEDLLYLPSLGRLIDLNSVSRIHWNEKGKTDRFRTVIFLETNVDNEDGVNSCEKISIYEKEDRKTFRTKFTGCLLVKLLFDEPVIEEESVVSTDPSDNNSVDIPY